MTRTKTQRRALVGLSSLIVAHYVSWFGNVITTVTVPLYVLGMTESGVQTGLAGFANTLPLVVAGALAGVFIDRLGGRAVSVAADLAAGALTLVLPFLIEGTDSPFVFLLVVLFVRSLIAAPAASARLSLIERMSSDAGVRLESSNTLFQSAQRVALIVGAPLAGVLFVVWGGPTALFIDAGTFFVAAIILWFGVPKPREDRAPSSDGDAESRSYFGMLADGFTYVRSSPLIVAILAVIIVSNFLDDAFAPLLLPAYSVEVLGSAGLLGVLLAGAGIGSVIGMFLYIPASGRVLRNRYWTFVASLLVVGLLRLVLVAYPSLPSPWSWSSWSGSPGLR
ncbi:MFS transporter [Curtobacterium sp. 24E2]|nr:MFS transporter [Curtobacterium sp. 24E2]